MCEYCEKERSFRRTNNKKIKCENFCGSVEMTIYPTGYEKNVGMLEIQCGNENILKKIMREKYCPRFNINYCPMCGKRLGEVVK